MTIKSDLDLHRTDAAIIDASSLDEIANSGTKDDITVAGVANYTSKSFNYEETNLNPFPNYDTDKGHIGAVDPGVSRSGDSVRMSRKLVLEASLRANTSATIVAPGHPDVIPPMCLSVLGVGDSFSGNYFIKSVKHSLGRAGYEMSLEVVRTLTALGVGNKPATPPVNTPHERSRRDKFAKVQISEE